MSKKRKSSPLKSITNKSEARVQAIERKKDGVEWTTHMVTWYEKNKRHRKQFKDITKAKNFANLKNIQIHNNSAQQHSVTTSLEESEIRAAEDAILKLGGVYTLQQAIDYFLENHRPPEHKTSLNQSIIMYLDDCEASGTRARTIKQKTSILNQFKEHMNDAYTHESTSDKIQSYLQRLRAKDGISKASRKTWNNYRNDLSHFFKWAITEDLATHRPHIFINPVDGIRSFTAKQIAEQRQAIAITSAHKLQRRLSALMSWKDGDLVKYFILAYFAGIRPDGELGKLAKRETELINLKTRTIHIPASISKTKEERQIMITDNLLAWLVAYADKPILPKNHSRLIKRARKAFKLSHDETRHSFISYHVALHRSVGDVALQAGNSESIVKKHYLNLRPSEDGLMFFSIIPNKSMNKAILSKKTIPPNRGKLKAV